MRPLTDQETRDFFEKLAKYIGKNIRHLIERQDEEWVFRLHKDRVYYVSMEVLKRAINVPRKEILSLGICFGKFSKSGKFRLHVTCLEYLAQHAQYKVWVRPTSELSFLYGHNIVKAGLGRITENTPQYQGVVIYSMSDIPLGFGVTARSTQDCRTLGPTDVVVFHQGDVGEYLREEDTEFVGDNSVLRKKQKKQKRKTTEKSGGAEKRKRENNSK